MKFDLKKKEAWGASFHDDRVVGVLVARQADRFAVRHVVCGRLGDAAEWKTLKKSFGKIPFYVPAGAGHFFSEGWTDMPEFARAKKMPSEFMPPNASFKHIDNLDAVKRAEVPMAIRTQMEQSCSFGNPAVVFCRRRLPDGSEEVLGAAVPDDVVQQDLRFWEAFGFKMPRISLEAVAYLNLYLAMSEGRDDPEWVMLIHSNGTGNTCFQLLKNHRQQLMFEAPCDLLGMGDDALMQLVEEAIAQASRRCDAYRSVRETLEAFWASDDLDCEQPPNAQLLTRVVFVSWAIGNPQEDSSLPGDRGQLEILGERFGALGLKAVYFDPFDCPELRLPEKYGNFAVLNRAPFQEAVGLAMQGL